MITKFTAVYAGHVGFPNRDQNASPNERRYSNEHLASVFARPRRSAKKMDGLGFEERYSGMQHISLSNPIGTTETVMIEQFQRLDQEVMQAFKPSPR